MKRKSLLITAKWLVGVIIFLALSAAVSRLFAAGMLHWARQGRISRLTELEILLLRRQIFTICILCGALYASALAKPECFGQFPRILKHMGWSYLLSILGCILAIRIELLPLPNFPSMIAVSTYIFVGLTVSALCIVGAIVAWVHLAFGGNPVVARRTAESTS
jgi:hypothetical protein